MHLTYLVMQWMGYSERLQIQPSRVTTTKHIRCNIVDHTRYPKLNGWQVSDGYAKFLYCFQLLVWICGICIQPQPAM
jgi:hypothetical protein